MVDNKIKSDDGMLTGIGKPMCREGSHRLSANRPSKPRIRYSSLGDIYEDEFGKVCRVLSEELEGLLNKYK